MSTQQHVKGRPSYEGGRLLADLMAYRPLIRRQFLRSLNVADKTQVLQAARRELGAPLAIYRDDPVGLTEDVLGETLWSKPKEFMGALGRDGAKVTVPSAFGTSKTHSAARAVFWFGVTRPPGYGLVVTTATRRRQVERLLWPHVRTLVAKSGMGHADIAQWKMPDEHGVDTVVAYGFSAPAHDEAAGAGIHAPELLVVVDESGGISRAVGQSLRGILVGKSTRLLAIGNPATDDEASWFEGMCDDPDHTNVRISAYDSPNLTGERTPRCKTCPRGMPAHPLSDHLVDEKWVADTIRDHGPDHPYVQAKVHAIFPKGGAGRAIPSAWIERAAEWDIGGYPAGGWVRLGVDVASDGGDELVVARLAGNVMEIPLVTSGPVLQNPTDVAGLILREIIEAEGLARRIGSSAKVRVKIDATGVGWGVAGILEAWGTEGLHTAQIVRFIAAEAPLRPDDVETQRPWKKKDEAWMAFRSLLRPPENDDTPPQVLLGRLDDRALSQLRAPKSTTNASGRTVVESKKEMRARGLRSPDRADAVLLTAYEPKPLARRSKIIVG